MAALQRCWRPFRRRCWELATGGAEVFLPGSTLGSVRGFADVRPSKRGTAFVPRLVARVTLKKASNNRNPDPTLLLPPFVSAAELRVILRLDYKGILHLLGVKQAEKKYFWKDFQGRQFETTSKRNVLVPFEMAAIPAQGLGLKPRMLDVEPDWKWESRRSGGALANRMALATHPVPVVAVLGHINHGKTTLLDALCGTRVAVQEPGGITQEVRAMTGRFASSSRLALGTAARPTDPEIEDVPPLPDEPQQENGDEEPQQADTSSCGTGCQMDVERMTFLDTPGHEAFEVLRGRTMAGADVAIVVVSVERGAEVQTEEVLLHAAQWKVPVVFALNKIDLPGAHVELTRAELRRQCQKLQERGLVNVDWTQEAEEAVPISALHGLHLEQLLERLRARLRGLPQLPRHMAEPLTTTPGEAWLSRRVQRRTDYLVGVEDAPMAVALVVEFERGEDNQGEPVLTLLVRAGRLAIGQHFVVGSVFGRIMSMMVAVGSPTRSWAKTETAGVGVAVQVTGLRQRAHGGDCAPDDMLFALSRERAWRLKDHRSRIEALAAIQTSGPGLQVPWEHDNPATNPRTQAAFDRKGYAQPERHSTSAYYESRWEQQAVEEVPALGVTAAAGSLTGQAAHSAGAAPSGFVGASRRDFQLPLQVGASATPDVGHVATGGRHSSRKRSAPKEAEPQDQQAPPQSDRRFLALGLAQEGTAAGGADGPPKASQAGAPARPLQTGAWTKVESHKDTGEQEELPDFVYYTERQSWTEEAAIDSERVRTRWRWRDVARWKQEDAEKRRQEEELEFQEKIRREVFGEPPQQRQEPGEGEGEGGSGARGSDEEVGSDSEEAEAAPLPPRNRPLVPLILKTKSVTQFDVLMDEMERVQDEFGVRVIIVHGGLGPVIPKDITHAEVEKLYGFCPVYAFQVGINQVAAKQADAQQIDVRRFDVFTELVADVAHRCKRILQKESIQDYTDSLKDQPSMSGF